MANYKGLDCVMGEITHMACAAKDSIRAWENGKNRCARKREAEDENNAYGNRSEI